MLEVQEWDIICTFKWKMGFAVWVVSLWVCGAVYGQTLDLSFDFNTPASHERDTYYDNDPLDVDSGVAFSLGLFSKPLFFSESRHRFGIVLGRQKLSVRSAGSTSRSTSYTSFNIQGGTDFRVVGNTQWNLSAGIVAGLSFMNDSNICNEMFCNLPESVVLVTPSLKVATRISSNVSGFLELKGSVYLTDSDTTFPYKSGIIFAIGVERTPSLISY